MWRSLRQNIKYKRNVLKEDHPIRYKIMTWLLIFLIIILVLFLLFFILVFVVLPIVFMCSVGLQRSLIFMNVQIPKEPKFDDPLQYGFKGVHNFYITSTLYLSSPDDVLSIGAWWLPHENYINSSTSMNDLLAKDEYPVVLYNHGVYATRILKVDYVYNTLRKFFHVVAIDYRAYGDSTTKDLTEDGVVTDVVRTYNLMKKKTKKDIYIWGHSLGGGISTHAVKVLKEKQNEIPAGLVVESSFTTLQEEVYAIFLSKYFRWLPWFDLCIIKPLHNNGLIFNTTHNIQDVDCPIMIMHAEDDNVIPFRLGKKNFELTNSSRKAGQGKVFFHPFAASKHYGHIGCTQDPEVPHFISEFMDECKKWKHSFQANESYLNSN